MIFASPFSSSRGAPLIAAAVALGTLCVGPARAQGVNFDAFLRGFEKCEATVLFAEFQNSIIDKYRGVGGKVRVNSSIKVAIPASILPGVGKAVAVNKGEYTEVTIPLDGLYRGFRLRSLTFNTGNGNGINNFVVHFAMPREELIRAFGAALAEGRRQLHLKYVGLDFSVGVLDNQAAIFCNMST